MRTLAFDGRMGASGDMICGALLAAGADATVLNSIEDALGVRYALDTTVKNGISATAVDVLLDSDEENHTHEHEHEHDHAEGAGPSRTYAEVIEVVESMALPTEVETDVKAIFEILGESEAAVHGTDLEATHFHEVGADDAIADVIGAALLLADLDVERIVTTPLATGGGEIEMSHGTYPVPTPAVVETAECADWSLRGGPVESELLTPTGAAILAHFAKGTERLPSLQIDESGYGAGDHDFPDQPNVLRVLVGESQGNLIEDEIRVLETNLDDASPEVLGGLHESLKAAGARDVSVIPTTMKKSRPGHLVKVIVKPKDAQRVARRLAVETGTLGVRETGVRHRWIAEREFETAEIDIEGTEYEVAVKIASDSEGEIYDMSAEYDDASAVAVETGMAVREIMRRVENTIRG